MSETIDITISPKGELSYQVKGVRGLGCKKLTAAIDALGQVKESRLTQEAFQTGQARQVGNK